MNIIMNFVQEHKAISLVIAFFVVMSVFGGAAADTARNAADDLSNRAVQIDASIEAAQGQ